MFWRNFKFKYKLTITNENTLEEVVGIHVSKLNGVSVLLLTFTVIFLIVSTIIVFTPLRNYLPGYMNSEVREQVVVNALRADSLQEALNRQSLYIMNIQDIFKILSRECILWKKYKKGDLLISRSLFVYENGFKFDRLINDSSIGRVDGTYPTRRGIQETV